MNEVTVRTPFYAWYTELSFRCVWGGRLKNLWLTGLVAHTHCHAAMASLLLAKPGKWFVLHLPATDEGGTRLQIQPQKTEGIFMKKKIIFHQKSNTESWVVHICYRLANWQQVTWVLEGEVSLFSGTYRKGINSWVTRFRRQWVQRKRAENWIIPEISEKKTLTLFCLHICLSG